MFSKAFLGALLLVILIACSNPIQSVSAPDRVGITLNLQPYWPELIDCQRELNQSNPIDVLPWSVLIEKDYPVLFRIGPPGKEDLFVTQTQELQIQLIVNLANPIVSLTDQQITSILLGSIDDWLEISPDMVPTSSPIHLWSYAAGDDVREQLVERVLNGHPLSSSSSLVPDSNAMLQAVMQDEAALGYVLGLQPLSEVKVLPVSPTMTALLEVPLLAVFPKDPSPAGKALIQCLVESGSHD